MENLIAFCQVAPLCVNENRVDCVLCQPMMKFDKNSLQVDAAI